MYYVLSKKNTQKYIKIIIKFEPKSCGKSPDFRVAEFMCNFHYYYFFLSLQLTEVMKACINFMNSFEYF